MMSHLTVRDNNDDVSADVTKPTRVRMLHFTR